VTTRRGFDRIAGKWFQLLAVGALALAPLGVTLWIVWLLAQLAAYVGGWVARPFLKWLALRAPDVERVLESGALTFAVEIGAALLMLTIVGFFAGNVVGKLFARSASSLILRVPLAGLVYSAAQKLIQSFQSPTGAAQKVVLIEFPSSQMKTVGLVTSTFTAADTGERLATVYVPTTPNPTSGYVEIVPVEKLVFLDWTVSEAIEFIVSAGVMAPKNIVYRGAAAEDDDGQDSR
jgi:uncharacterized membrane protein